MAEPAVLLRGVQGMSPRLEHTSNEDQWKIRLLASKQIRKSVAGHVGQQDVQHRQPRWLSPSEFFRLLSPLRGDDRIARVFEQLNQQLEQLLVVVDQQARKRHLGDQIAERTAANHSRCKINSVDYTHASCRPKEP